MRAGSVGIVKDEGLIRSAFCEEGFCSVFALVGIDGVFAGGGGPHAASGIPDDGDGFADSLFFACDKLGSESGGDLKGRSFFLRGEGTWLAGRFGFPMKCAGSGCKFLDGDIFQVDLEGATAVSLETNETVLGNAGSAFDEVESGDTVDP